jgi:uncharacterized protein YqgQ
MGTYGEPISDELDKLIKAYPKSKFYTKGETTADIDTETILTDSSVTEKDYQNRKLRNLLQSITADIASNQSRSYEYWFSELSQEMRSVQERIESLSKPSEALLVEINLLPTKKLSRPLTAIIEPDGEGFIARSVDLPLYGYSEDRIEAIEMLKDEIESLYEDLMEDDDFNEDYLRIKHFLADRIVS